MFVKVIWPTYSTLTQCVSLEVATSPDEKTGKDRYVFFYLRDGRDRKVGDVTVELFVTDCSIYVMNDEGKTIDTYQYTCD